MQCSRKIVIAGLALSIVLLSFAPIASAGPKEDVAASTLAWAQALGENNSDKVWPLYSDDAVLWGTLSPMVRADRAALRDYFVTAFKVLPGLKVAFGDQLIRVYGDTAVNTGYYTFSLGQGWGDKDPPCALQLHLHQERRALAHCRPSFLGHATAPEIALRLRGGSSAKRTAT
jgi:hypothetical protein